MTHGNVPESVICVGAVVKHGDAVLAVRQSHGHPLEGRWTIPWGRAETGESPAAAALREVAEEGGVTARLGGLLGIQELPAPWLGWIAIVYHCEHGSGQPEPDNYETDRAAYLTLAQINALCDSFEPWSLWLMRKSLASNVTVTEQDSTNPFAPMAGFI